MGNRAKSQFCSFLLNEFHHRTKLMALLFSTFAFKRQLGTQNIKTLSPKGTSHTNSDSEWEMKNLLNEFHHRTNLMALLFSNMGSRNKTIYSELWNSGS
jgi:hypothetical protein